MDIRDDSELFKRHSDSVLCCSIDDNTRLAVSGGIDDTAFVWDLNTRHVIFECLGHKESVVAAAFSSNSTYVATGDLNGYIQVRNTTTGIKVFDFDIDEINWILWHNSSEYVMLAGTVKGDFWMWNVNDPAAVKTFTSYGSSSTAARLLPDGMKVIVAYQDGSVRVFDLKTKQSIFHYQDSSRAEVICLDLNSKKSILAIGCIDSSIKLLTVGNLKVIGTLNCKTPDDFKDKPKKSTNDDESMEDDAANEPSDNEGNKDAMTVIKSEPIEVIDEYSNADAENLNQDVIDEEDLSEDYNDNDLYDLESVECVLFSPCGNYLAAANNSGTIVIWDVSTQVVRSEVHTGVGITRASWTFGGNFVSGHLDGTVRIFDNNLVEKQKIIAHQDQILDLAVKNNIVVTASEDKTLRVIKL